MGDRRGNKWGDWGLNKWEDCGEINRGLEGKQMGYWRRKKLGPKEMGVNKNWWSFKKMSE